jgi:hypothetical protein
MKFMETMLRRSPEKEYEENSRYLKDDPSTKNFLEEQGLKVDDLLNFARERAVRNSKSVMGVLTVLLFKHVENELIEIFRATRNRDIVGESWDGILKCYDRASINLRKIPEYPYAFALKELNNSFKHREGIATKKIDLPGQRSIPAGATIDFSDRNIIDFPKLTKSAISFLEETLEMAMNPLFPAVPSVLIEVQESGSHILRSMWHDTPGIKNNPQFTADMHFSRLICDGPGSRGWIDCGVLAWTDKELLLPGCESGKVILYRAMARNSRGEESEYCDPFVIIQP